MVAVYRERWTAEMGPLALGPVLRVPTDGPVDLAAVTAWIGACWATDTPVPAEDSGIRQR